MNVRWLHTLVQFGFQRRRLLWVIFAFVAGYGAYSWQQLPIEAYPDIADVSSQIVTQVPGLAAEEVEQQITIPLERALLATPGMHVLRSRSLFALSLITVVFDDDVDGYWARERLKERIAAVELPYEARAELDPYTSPIGEVYRYTLESNLHSLRELSQLQQWVVIPHLTKLKDIAEVSNFGGVTTQFMVELDADKLRHYGLALGDVIDALEANNASAGGSVLNLGDLSYVVRGVGVLTSLQDMGDVVITTTEAGVPVLVKDVGALHYGQMERRGILGKDHNPDTLEGIVLLLKDANPSAALTRIHAAVDELNNGILPPGVRVVPYLDRSDLITATTRTLGKTLSEALLVVVLVLLLFLASPRAAAIVALTIPFSLLFAFAVMHHADIPANLLSLGAIDFGILVDGAVVVVENILRQRETRKNESLRLTDAVTSTLQVARPMFFGMCIIAAAYLPLFAFERIERKLFAPMVSVIGSALVGALLAALLLTPALAWLAFKTPRPLRPNRSLDWLKTRYTAFLHKTLPRRRWILVSASSAIVVLVLLAASIGRDFLPYLDEGSIWLQVQMPPGITLDKAQAMADELRRVTLEFPEVSHIVTQTGRNDDGTDYWTPSHIEASVGLHPYHTWASGLSKQQLIEKMSARYAQMPGYDVGFMQPMIDGVQDKLSGAHSDLTIKIYGPDLTEDRRIADAMAAILRTIKGAADVAVDIEPPLPNLRIDLDRGKAARYGINAADVAQLIANGIGGAAIGEIYLDERRYDMAVRFAPEYRKDPEMIGQLRLNAANGAQIPLAEIARMYTTLGQSVIVREGGQRHILLRLNVRGRDLAGFLNEAHARIEQQLQYDPSAIHIEWGGQFENLARAQSRFALIAPLTLGLMLILLYAELGNLRQPLLILGILPLGLIGGLAGLHLRGMSLNISSAVGFIALFGVQVLAALLMVSQINRLRREEQLPLHEAVLHGAASRLRPVLMTATVAAFGLVPAMLATGLGSDVQRPLATVVVFGLTSATLLTLLMLPQLYYLVERFAEKRNLV